ncbi:B3 domain-containing transcription factor VRN1 isoform X2 [Cucumis sativus]|uniref:B3 domain-containing transcription factor VRN1 isoform X2 n=1 Tax=Cucumis sativus TaxID=3659 RepID=UPI0012F4B778|nr:B3 domain-containing transcription factor VRN1 isoform X2 [Cucumis sativus]
MASPPKFFKILLITNVEDPKLMIPRMFIKSYGKLLSSSVILKLPDGREWKIGLTTSDNGAVWLEKGWDKFSEHYCLEYGFLLVFKLLNSRGTSSFKVNIFNTTAMETEYSWNVKDFTKEFDSDSDGSESFCPHSKKRNKASVPRRRLSKKTRKEDHFSIKTEPEEGECNIFSDIPKEEVEISRRIEELKNRGESNEKLGFKVVMSQSNVGGRFNLVIPKEFAGKYLSDEVGSISIQTENGKKWSLLYKWSESDDEVAYISRGWRDFVEENLLKPGDVVFFELIKKDKFLFTKLQENITVPSSSPKNKTASTTNPFFEVQIHKKSYGNTVLNIPLGFANKHFSPEMHHAKLQVWNKEWEVKLKQYVNHCRFSAGWSKFYRENMLRDGETCLFEMVSKRNCIFKVSIFS